MNKTFSIIIPVYKNTDMVVRNLKHNVPFFKGCEVIVVDDASDNGLAEKVRTAFPTITVLENKHNMGFGPTVNRGVSAAKGDYLVLLGSDVKLIEPLSLSYCTKFEKDPTLFALSFKQKERDGSSMGKNRIFFTKGMPGHAKTHDLQPGRNAWADGGSSIVRADMFKELGGFCDLYAPFYWEDVDLSYRAMKRGWHSEFDPSIFVEHHHESTIGSLFTKDHVRMISYRNQLLFTWSVLTYAPYLLSHVLWLAWYIIRIGTRDTAFLKGFVMAIMRLPAVFRQRHKLVSTISDKDIFTSFPA